MKITRIEPKHWIIAAGMPLLAAALQYQLWPYISGLTWFLFYPTVFYCSWMGGLRIGLLSTALSVLLAWWIFIPPAFIWQKPSLTWVSVILFSAMGVLFSLSHEKLRRIRQKADKALAALQEQATSLADLYDHAPCGYHSLDKDGTFVRINDTELTWLGYEREEVIGKLKLTDISTPASSEIIGQNFPQFMQRGSVSNLELELLRKDGSKLTVLLNSTAIYDKDGRFLMSRSTLFDMTERREADERMRRDSALLQNIHEGVIITDPACRIIEVNKAYEQISGFEAREVIGLNPRFQQSGRHGTDFYKRMWDEIKTSSHWHGEIWNRRKNGEIYPAWQAISEVRDASGALRNYISVIADISSIKQAEEKLAHIAHHDALTGLPNRLLLSQTLDKFIDHAQRNHSKIALLLLDVDNFKLINDTLGHEIGDQLLQKLSARLTGCIRSEDIAARMGGDEFVIVLGDSITSDHISHVARKIISVLREPMTISNREIVASGSLGISVYPDDGLDSVTLLKYADEAMYLAKKRGRDQFAFYSSDLTDQAMMRLRLESDLRGALYREQLELYYQPQVDLQSGHIVGMEALLRWNHPELGLVLPEKFIGIAEDCGLISEIGLWVIGASCKQAREWIDGGTNPKRIAINLSGRQIDRDDICKMLEDAMHDHKLTPNDVTIELEVTENAIQSMHQGAEILRRLHMAGTRIAIDDFGIGYSSLSRLKHLPIDALKVDQVFVRGIPEDKDAMAITSAVISMGHSLGLKIIAEGIETAAQLAYLREQGCDEGQGYFLGGAMRPAAATRAMLSDLIKPVLPTASRVIGLQG